MPNSAEVNSIKWSWLYGRAQQREIELREIWKKTRNLDMLTGTVQHTMHGHAQHTVPHRHLQQKTSSKKKPEFWWYKKKINLEVLPVEGNRAPWLWPAHRCRTVADVLFPFSLMMILGFPFSQWSPTVTPWFPQSNQSRRGPSTSSSPTAA